LNKEEQLLAKLLKIAEKQQKAIEKIAQTVAENPSGELAVPGPHPTQDPTIEYLMRAIPTAAANVGINNVVVMKVDKHPSALSDSGATMEDTYVAQIKGIPGKLGDTFKQTWDKQLAAQKPDLVGRVGFFFAD
jgi:hypothetical protein